MSEEKVCTIRGDFGSKNYRPVTHWVGAINLDSTIPTDKSLKCMFKRFPEQLATRMRNTIINERVQKGALTRELGIHRWESYYDGRLPIISEEEARDNIREAGASPASTREALSFFSELYMSIGLMREYPRILVLGGRDEYDSKQKPIIFEDDDYPFFGYTEDPRLSFFDHYIDWVRIGDRRTAGILVSREKA